MVAPSLIPQKPGERVKTDKRDSIRLAQLLRAGELTSIYVPTKEDEALRDLVRAREDVKEDQTRARHRLSKFLLRHNIRQPEGVRRWTVKYHEWLTTLDFPYAAMKVTFQEYRQQLTEFEQRLKRLEEEIQRQATEGEQATAIQSLQVLRGVAVLTATSLVAEIGSFQLFRTAREFGFVLGGPVGLGTIIIALMLGRIIQQVNRIFKQIINMEKIPVTNS